ncbi:MULTISPECIES: hypothetical protein [Burkholderia]|uniref:hypothetical protein n=1 Tax=Burkholderia TaxID=32008 RepID=UPI000E64B1F8|nr:MULTISPECIES: hypothetical protein [Burkholderia]MCR5893351.1 hypothetical protein [Burkholderia sp. HAN2018]
MSDSFDSFIREQASSANKEEGKLDLEREKQTWLLKLDTLFDLVRRSLDAYLKDGTISFVPTEYNLHEELLGSYVAKGADLIVGRHLVKLKPVGTFLLGARGRVDMIGPRGIAKLVIVPPDSTQVKVTVTIVEPGQPRPESKPGVPPEQWVWKIATPPPRIIYTTLNEDSFRSALMGVMGGVDE